MWIFCLLSLHSSLHLSYIPHKKTTDLFVEEDNKGTYSFFLLSFLRLYGGNLEMLQVPVLELGNICLETSTKDQCEKHSLSNMRSPLPEREKRKEWISTNLDSWNNME